MTAKTVTPTCSSCRFWREREHLRVAGKIADRGECKRYPPTTIRMGVVQHLDVKHDEWCGEHEPA